MTIHTPDISVSIIKVAKSKVSMQNPCKEIPKGIQFPGILLKLLGNSLFAAVFILCLRSNIAKRHLKMF